MARIDSLKLTYQWFDYVMRGGPKPALLTDRINYEVMGANLWRHAPSIDAMSNKKLKLYLTSERMGDHYRLSASKPAHLGSLTQTVDLADRKSRNNLYPATAIADPPEHLNGYMCVSDPFEVPVSVSGLITPMT